MLKRALVAVAASALVLAGMPAAQAAQPELIPTAAVKSSTFPQLVQSLPYVDPLYVGYRGTEQFIPKAVALKKDARGCVLRQRMIIDLATVKPKVSKGCRMKGGTWVVNGGATTVKTPKGLVVSPVLMYKQAWGQGAYAWTPEQRLAWATNTGTGKQTRAKAVTNQATQGLFTNAWRIQMEREVKRVPEVYRFFQSCFDMTGNLFSCLHFLVIVGYVSQGELGDESQRRALLESSCRETVRFAANASAWGLTVDPQTQANMAAAATSCRSVGIIDVLDEASVHGIAPVPSLTVGGSVAVPEAPAAATGVRIFGDYATPAGNPVSGDLFGLHAPVGYGNPQVQPGYVRIWDSDASWKDIEKTKGTYTWDTLSASIDNSMGAKVMYVLGNTPGWANGGKDGATPPTNLQDAADFVGAVCKRFGSRISSYEVWNEGNLVTFWTGSMSELADLTQRVRDKVRECGSGAQVVASSAGARADGGFATRFKEYLGALGGRGWPVDAYSVHSYPAANGGPEQRLQELAQFKAMLALTGAPVKPVYDTELNYGLAGLGQGKVAIDDATGAGYLAQTYIQSVQYGVDSAFWYLWTASDYGLLGMQFNPSTNSTKAAWNTLRSWLIGSRIQRCGESGVVRECQFTSDSGMPFTLVWATSGTATVDINGIGYSCLSLMWGPCTQGSGTVTVGVQPVRITY